MKKQKDVDMTTDEVCFMKAFNEDHRNLHHEGGKSG